MTVGAATTLVGVGAAVVGARALLHRQAAIARRRLGKPRGEQAIDADRVWRRSYDGDPVELLMVGDSIAAGLGAEPRKDTLGGRLAKSSVTRKLRGGSARWPPGLTMRITKRRPTGRFRYSC